ncbi:hypothetical protein SNE40_012708 [Patella caerulea]|uniref:Uncharacterized protein n=1 Tax=Patella caerulea TaxID=87958 RepID=A0AAN8JPH3_PATCE
MQAIQYIPTDDKIDFTGTSSDEMKCLIKCNCLLARNKVGVKDNNRSFAAERLLKSALVIIPDPPTTPSITVTVESSSQVSLKDQRDLRSAPTRHCLDTKLVEARDSLLQVLASFRQEVPARISVGINRLESDSNYLTVPVA